MADIIKLSDPNGVLAWGAKELRKLAGLIEAGEINCINVIAVKAKEPKDLYFLRGTYNHNPDLYALLGGLASAQHGLSEALQNDKPDDEEDDCG